MNKRMLVAATAAALLAAASQVHAIDLTAAGYSQNFDSMGQNGVTLPAGWSMWVHASGDASTYSTSVLPGAVDGLFQTRLVAAQDIPNGLLYAVNAANLGPAPATDRVVATSPTEGGGVALQLSLTNATGQPIHAFEMSFDVVRYSAAALPNELPGFSMLVTRDDGTGSSGLSVPGMSLVPNTIGTSHFVDLRLGSGHALMPGQTLLFWWFDDNAQQSSPDQIIGLNNVFIAPAPEPASFLMLAGGLAALGLSRARLRSRASRLTPGATATPSARTAAHR